MTRLCLKLLKINREITEKLSRNGTSKESLIYKLQQFKKDQLIQAMQNHRFILNEYMNLILNKRVSVNQDVNNQHILNQTLNSKSNEVSLCISIYLEHTLSHRKFQQNSGFCNLKVKTTEICHVPISAHLKKSLCCMFTKSSLYQNFLNKQECYQNYLLQIVIEHNGKNQNLELYKCYHLNMEQDVSIIARFHQHLNLTQEVGKPRSLSFQEQTMIPKQNNRLRFNSEQVRTPERKVLMYSVDEEVTFLIDEDQIERVMSHNSDSDYMIQTIEEETDVSEWQVIDHKHLLTRDQKKLLNSLQEMRNLFNSKSKHSHQIKQALELFF